MSLGHVYRIRDIIDRHRFQIGDEKALQHEIAEALRGAVIGFEREVRLAPGDIVDFVSNRVGIEVKVKGGKRAILRQLERYAESDQVDFLILVSAVAMGLPAEIKGKPVLRVSLGKAWL